uniref:Josephin-2 n=1 Tax=Strigamia maritima TaxID=126957 RepID=T1J928_STRMM
MLKPNCLKSIYHEKQVKELCALHALNNLFQNSSAFTKPLLDEICYNLSPNHFLNPHKSIFGLGNYDVNVIMAALQLKNCEAIWFDKRKDPSCLNFYNIQGFILNIPTEYYIGFVKLPIQRKHWIAIRQVDDVFYNLDSKLDKPELIGGENELLVYLRQQIDMHEREIFVIVKKEVKETESWRIGSTEFNSFSESVEYITASESSSTPDTSELITLR